MKDVVETAATGDHAAPAKLAVRGHSASGADYDHAKVCAIVQPDTPCVCGGRTECGGRGRVNGCCCRAQAEVTAQYEARIAAYERMRVEFERRIAEQQERADLEKRQSVVRGTDSF